jgi:hypothetical protein
MKADPSCTLESGRGFNPLAHFNLLCKMPQRPLSLRFSGVNPDASMQGPNTAHQFASLLMRNPPQGPLPLRFSGVNPDASMQGQPSAHQFASLLMRNPG